MKFIQEESPSAFTCETSFRIWLERGVGAVLLSAGAPGTEDHEVFGSDTRALHRARQLAVQWNAGWCDTCLSWHVARERCTHGNALVYGECVCLLRAPSLRMELRAPRAARCFCGAMAIGRAAYKAGHTAGGCHG